MLGTRDHLQLCIPKKEMGDEDINLLVKMFIFHFFEFFSIFFLGGGGWGWVGVF